MKGFVRGLGAYPKALPLIRKLGLWRYVGLTALVTLGLFVVILPLFAVLGYWLIAPLHQRLFAGVNPILSNLVILGIILGLLALAYLFYKHVILVVAGPWMTIVATRVGEHLRGEGAHKTQAAFAKTSTAAAEDQASFARSLRLNLRLGARELLITVPLLLLGLVPGVNLVSVVLLLMTQSYFAGAGVLDVSLERTHDYRSSLAYLKTHRGLAIGLGSGFVALMLTVVGVLFIPVWCAAAGAVAVYEEHAA